MCLPLLNAIRVARLGPGRPRTRRDAVLADKAYSSRALPSSPNPATSRGTGSGEAHAEADP